MLPVIEKRKFQNFSKQYRETGPTQSRDDFEKRTITARSSGTRLRLTQNFKKKKGLREPLSIFSCVHQFQQTGAANQGK